METVEINKILYAFANPEGCWHELAVRDDIERPRDVHWKWYGCTKCTFLARGYNDWINHPDYTSEESPRRLLAEVEAKFIAAFGADAYFTALVLADNGNPDGMVGIAVATASALTRSTAMAEYLKEKK